MRPFTFAGDEPLRVLAVGCHSDDVEIGCGGARVKDWFEDLKTTVDPDVVFTHHGHDRHQDHRLVAELTWNTFRRHLILEYEVPKYDGDLGSPNVFVPLDEDVVAK